MSAFIYVYRTTGGACRLYCHLVDAHVGMVLHKWSQKDIALLKEQNVLLVVGTHKVKRLLVPGKATQPKLIFGLDLFVIGNHLPYVVKFVRAKSEVLFGYKVSVYDLERGGGIELVY